MTIREETRPGISIDILELGNLTHSKYMSEYGIPNRPFVIADGARNWKAMSSWTLDFFKSKYGHIRLKVIKDIGEGRRNESIMTVAEYIDYLKCCKEENPYYLRDWTLEVDFPELLDDYNIPTYIENWLERIPIEENSAWWLWRGWKGWLFIGPKGTGTQPHVDVANSSTNLRKFA